MYGSDDVRAAALRTLDGTGQLKTSEGRLLPFNVDGLPNAGGSDPGLFLAGDVLKAVLFASLNMTGAIAAFAAGLLALKRLLA